MWRLTCTTMSEWPRPAFISIYIDNLVLITGKLSQNLRVIGCFSYIFAGSSFATSLLQKLCCRKVKAVGHLSSTTFFENVNFSWKELFPAALTHFRAQMRPRCKSMITLALHAVARYIHFYLHISTGHQLKELRIMPTIKSHSWTFICPKPDSLSHDTFLYLSSEPTCHNSLYIFHMFFNIFNRILTPTNV